MSDVLQRGDVCDRRVCPPHSELESVIFNEHAAGVGRLGAEIVFAQYRPEADLAPGQSVYIVQYSEHPSASVGRIGNPYDYAQAAMVIGLYKNE